MEERAWKLGKDLSTNDNLLDEVTFDGLILAVRCNCRVISQDAVKKQLEEILEERLTDALFLLENNMEEIIQEARKGRG